MKKTMENITKIITESVESTESINNKIDVDTKNIFCRIGLNQIQIRAKFQRFKGLPGEIGLN